MDRSHGYERHAEAFASLRDRSEIGAGLVRRWAQALPAGCEILEIGCGAGHPVSRELVAAGLKLWAIDASPSLLARFRERFPEVPTRCEPAETSELFGRRFDAVISIGLILLLDEAAQLALIERFSAALRPDGQLLFSAPEQTGSWDDRLTGLESRSLGKERYEAALRQHGLQVVGHRHDRGENHHYEARKVG